MHGKDIKPTDLCVSGKNALALFACSVHSCPSADGALCYISRIAIIRRDQHGRMHTNEKSHVKLITFGSNGPYRRRKRADLNPLISV